MSLIPWRSKRENAVGEPALDLRREMDRLFDSFFREPFGWFERGLARWSEAYPPVEVSEEDEHVVVRAEVPGIDPKELDLAVTARTLTISGEKKESQQRKGEGYVLSERHYGVFRREIALPVEVDAEQVTAECTQGVLTVRLKKAPQSVGRRIQVKGG
jgi:HSP20 family protein